MSNREVMAYFSGLRLARLTAAGAYNVYSVPPGGLVKVHVQKLRIGTPVFADTFGNPIMILKCGNPLTRGPKSPEALIEPDPLLIVRKTEELRELETETEEMIGLEELQAMTPEDVARPVDQPEEIITTNESPIPILPAGAPIGGWILGLLGGGLIIGGGGGGSDDFNETIVPEPATLGVMVVAGAGLALRRRTTRKGR